MNRDKGNCVRNQPSAATDENVERVRTLLENSAKVGAQQNEIGLSVPSFNCITRNKFKWYLDQIHARHQFIENKFQRRLDFAQWFICPCQNSRSLANVVIGDIYISPWMTQLLNLQSSNLRTRFCDWWNKFCIKKLLLDVRKVGWGFW